MKFDLSLMGASADRASELLKSLGNRHRLLILCQLLDAERSVGDLASFLGIRDSTVSQHLARLRGDGLVRARREGQTIWYSISSDPARQVLGTLYRCFCTAPETIAKATTHAGPARFTPALPARPSRRAVPRIKQT